MNKFEKQNNLSINIFELNFYQEQVNGNIIWDVVFQKCCLLKICYQKLIHFLNTSGCGNQFPESLFQYNTVTAG